MKTKDVTKAKEKWLIAARIGIVGFPVLMVLIVFTALTIRPWLVPRFYAYGWASTLNIAPGDLAFPGYRVSIPVSGLQALQGHYRLSNVWVTSSGHTIDDITHSGVDTGLISHPDTIFYQQNPVMVPIEPGIRFRLPDDSRLYGNVLPIQYRATFYYPERSDNSHFVWKSEVIQGDASISIGTEKQGKILRVWFIALIALEAICVLGLLTSVIATIATLHKP